jgi:S-formylglutathione hydrolase FrmB
MGGFGALELSMRHQDLFAAAASHSGVDALMYVGPHPYAAGKVELVTDPKIWGVAVEDIGKWVRPLFGPDLANWLAHDPAALVAKLEPGKLALYIDCGSQDRFLLNDEAAYLHDLLLAKKIDHEFFLGPGDHDFNFWAPRLPKSLAFLRAHTAKPTPR